MGIQKITQKQKELSDQQIVLRLFYEVADKLQASLTRVLKAGQENEEAWQKLFKQKEKLIPAIQNLPTVRVKEFEAYKDHMLDLCTTNSFAGELKPIAPLKKAVDNTAAEVQQMMSAWLEKQEAAMPKEWKKGMVFRDYTGWRVIELTSDAEKATNVNLQGDFALFYKFKFKSLKVDKEGTGTDSKGSLLKNKLKFIKV
jgi:hypothetical protein